jgi:hypothetical protein
MIAIQSFSSKPFYNSQSERFTGGFNTYDDFINCAKKSVLSLKKHLPVNLYTDDRQLLEPILQYYDQVIDIEVPYNPYYFAYSKLIAYQKQEQPFVHIDLDFIVDTFDIGTDITVEGKELYTFYLSSFSKLSKYDKDIQLFVSKGCPSTYAYTTGIFGGYDLKFIKEYVDKQLKIITKINSLNDALAIEQGLLGTLSFARNKKYYCYNKINTYLHYVGNNKINYIK